VSNTIQADGSIHEDQLLNFLVNTIDEEVELDIAPTAETTSEDVHEVLRRGVEEHAIDDVVRHAAGAGAEPEPEQIEQEIEDEIVTRVTETGGDTTEFLTHADPAIRACAALAPGQRGNPAALAELLEAVRDPEALRGWFDRCPERFAEPERVRSALLREAVLRGGPDAVDRVPATP
jgi:HEAT repeat protein